MRASTDFIALTKGDPEQPRKQNHGTERTGKTNYTGKP